MAADVRFGSLQEGEVLPVGKARRVVQVREGICLARMLDPGAGPCADQWGLPPTKYQGPEYLEVDRVREAPGSKPGDHTDPFRMVAICPGHHRGMGPSGGSQWATANREIIRDYLSRRVVQEKTRILIDSLV